MIGRVLAGVIAAAVTAALASACSTSEPAQPRVPQPAPNTFTETIEPILQNRCQSCHHAGGIAPFSLETYEDVVAHAGLARIRVTAHDMPPWGAFDDPDCVVSHGFKDDLRMPEDEIQKFADWVDSGMPRGDASKAPTARTFAASGLVDKTHTFQIAQPFDVPAGGTDDFRCFPIDPGFTTDTWIAGANVVPGDPRVVHHVLVFVDPSGESAAKVGPDGEYPCFGGPGTSNPSLLAAWAPGVPPAYYGEDAGIRVPKGAHLVMQVHYHPHPEISGHDQSSFELKVLPGGIPSFVTTILLAGNASSSKGLIHLVPPSGDQFLIPANAANHVEAMEVTIPASYNGGTLPPMSVLAAGSHMHWAGVNMRIEIARKSPSDTQPAHECLLGTPKYNFNWQRAYSYDEPMERLPVVTPGDTLRFTCTYDNTTNNPYVLKALAEQRLGAPRDIHLGETTLDEMCLGVLVLVRRASVLDSFGP
jgi:hypothetical protein